MGILWGEVVECDLPEENAQDIFSVGFFNVFKAGNLITLRISGG